MWISSREYQKRFNVSPQLFYLWKTTNKIKTKNLVKGGHCLVEVEDDETSSSEKKVVVYGRVSTTKQKKDLENQINTLKQYAVSRGYNPEVYKDIASGMTEHRKGLNSMIDEIVLGNVSKVIISHKDRLSRFGFGYLESFFKRFGTEIEIVNLEDEKSFENELTEDLISIIHHFSMKFYGKRRNQIIDFGKTLKTENSISDK